MLVRVDAFNFRDVWWRTVSELTVLVLLVRGVSALLYSEFVCGLTLRDSFSSSGQQKTFSVTEFER